jgi:hypothetical protein
MLKTINVNESDDKISVSVFDLIKNCTLRLTQNANFSRLRRSRTSYIIKDMVVAMHTISLHDLRYSKFDIVKSLWCDHVDSHKWFAMTSTREDDYPFPGLEGLYRA